MEDRTAFLEGEKVGLYPVEEEDLEALRDIINKKEVRVPMHARTPANLEKEKEWFEEGSETRFVIYSKGDGRVVGVISLSIEEEVSRVAETGYFIDSDHHSKGLGTESLELVLEYGFKELNLHRVWARVNKNNEKSIGLLEKMGFEKEGELREHIFVQGEYVNVLKMGLLREEYLEK